MAIEVWDVSAAEGQGIEPDLIDPQNYARKGSVVRRVREEVLSKLDMIRSERQTWNSRAENFYKVWAGEHTIRYYSGESDLRIQIVRDIVDTLISQTRSQIFPNSQFVFIEPTNPFDELSKALKPAAQIVLEHDVEQARVRTQIDKMLTDIFVYGVGIVKTRWKMQLAKKYKPSLREGTRIVDSQTSRIFEGPTFKVVDPLRWYIAPLTAESIEDAEMIFEDLDVDWMHLKSMEKRKIYWKVDRLKQERARGADNATARDINADRDARLSQRGHNTQTGAEFSNRYSLTEIWAKFDLYGDGNYIPCKIVVSGDTVLEVRQNPFYHQQPPYLAGQMVDMRDDFMGQGIVQLLEPFQYAIEAMINQGLDAANFHLNHIIIANINALAGDPQNLTIAPRAVWPVTDDPGKAIEVVRPDDTSQTAFASAAHLIGLVRDIGNTPPILQGNTGATDSATEAAEIAANASAPLAAFTDRIESQLMTPLLQRWWELEQQFRGPNSHFKITGMPTVKMNPKDFVGDYQFKWFTGPQSVQRLQLIQAGGGMTAVPQGATGGGSQGGGLGGNQ